jgi:general secretion pathway protein E
MRLLHSDDLLDLLVDLRVLTPKQQQFVLLEKGKMRQKLLRAIGKEGEIDKDYPDMVDIVTAFNFKLPGGDGRLVDEETIIQAIARSKKLPFKKLDPLELDMDVATKTIPRNFAIRQMILPFKLEEGILETAIYHPDCQTALADIEQTNQVKIRPYLATKSDIKRIIAEFFGFQRSISATSNAM